MRIFCFSIREAGVWKGCLTVSGDVGVQVKLEREVCVEEFSALKALGRVFLRSQGCTVAVGVVTRVVQEVQEEA